MKKKKSSSKTGPVEENLLRGKIAYPGFRFMATPLGHAKDERFGMQWTPLKPDQHQDVYKSRGNRRRLADMEGPAADPGPSER